MEENIKLIILDSIEEYNDGLPLDEKISKNPSDTIYGKSSRLDSLGLVSFIVNLEQNVEDKLGKAISLADEKAMSQNQIHTKISSRLLNSLVPFINQKYG